MHTTSSVWAQSAGGDLRRAARSALLSGGEAVHSRVRPARLARQHAGDIRRYGGHVPHGCKPSAKGVAGARGACKMLRLALRGDACSGLALLHDVPCALSLL